LAEILAWLQEAKTYSIDSSLIEIAKTNMDVNIAKSWQKVEPTSQEKIKALVS